jgi:hypothetical protein
MVFCWFNKMIYILSVLDMLIASYVTCSLQFRPEEQEEHGVQENNVDAFFLSRHCSLML